ncbi:hypothetical protein DFR48_105178 [Ciceribacter lividus]|uniref:Uncharacterized protein n=1 Tax=Ciceribacter lividus TaxID=1197950 RepID=A0A6I7HM88_9HYPH|nr:hypothetical protein [Ciceribacter lividus]RCW24833.1 hypothetical protein DFR48_105178 [Ciceribacter lividus]
MASNENSFGLSPHGGEARRPSRNTLHPLHEAAMRIADLGRKRSMTKDLIGLLLCHGARAWRYSQPEANIHLHVCAPGGRAPVVLRLR